MRRRRFFGILIVIGALAIIGITVYRAVVSDNPFSDKYCVLAAAPWHIPIYEGGDNDDSLYTWQDNETIVYAQRNKQQKYRLMRQRVRGSHPSSPEPVPNIPAFSDLKFLAASPNGKWLMTMHDFADNNWAYTIFALDTGAVKQRYATRSQFNTWMPDSRSFLCDGSVNRFVERLWAEPHRADFIMPTLAWEHYDTLLSTGEYLTFDETMPNSRAIQFYRGSIFTHKYHLMTMPTHLSPSQSHINSTSPHGDRFLWRREWSDVSWLNRLTHRNAAQKYYEQWFVTDANGDSSRNVVTLYTGNDDSDLRDGLPTAPRWLPDGKHVSMVYKGALYVVPVS